ncbi:MAG: hypothetical protein V3T42_06680, partial [Nitrospirales bacterium]
KDIIKFSRYINRSYFLRNMGEETEVFQNEQLPFSRWLYPLTMVLGLISMILNACGTDQKS